MIWLIAGGRDLGKQTLVDLLIDNGYHGRGKRDRIFPANWSRA